jgi:hypothetical protein
MFIPNYLEATGSVLKYPAGAPFGEEFLEAQNKIAATVPSGSVVRFAVNATTGKIEAYAPASLAVYQVHGVLVNRRPDSAGAYADSVKEDEIGIYQISGYCKKVICSATTASNKFLTVANTATKALPATTRNTATFGYAVGDEAASGSDYLVAAMLYGNEQIVA